MQHKTTKPVFILDVDGVMTTGQFLYSAEGKAYKVFGAHDSDGLKMIKKYLEVVFITADTRGLAITKRRVEIDLGFPLLLLSEEERYQYLDEKYGLKNIIFMADGYHDAKILKDCQYGIAPKNARVEAREAADFVTPTNSGEGAVLDACLHLIKYLKLK
jgi:3-deoxy-D-manno-octulosonate 8-phosphate phosphatase (KDO 8-P phosphatase)